MPTFTTYSVYGIRIASDSPFRFPVPMCADLPDVIFTWVHQPPENRQQTESQSYTLVTYDTERGEELVSIHRLEDSYVLQVSDYLDYTIKTNSITAQVRRLEDQPMVEVFLLGPVLVFWWYLQGKLGLHAAAIDINEKAVLFSAYKGSGKSSLSASFLQDGHALLSDDYAAIDFVKGEYQVQPGYPQMKMWDDQAARFIENYENLERVDAYYPKRAVPIGLEGYGRFTPLPRPLQAIYIPQRRRPENPDKSILIEALPKAIAVTTLMQTGVVNYYRQWTPFHAQNMRLLADLVKVIPVRKVTYPSGYDLLPGVRDAILNDIEHLP